MTRDALARKIHWPFIIWAAGIVNVFAMAPQLIELVKTRQTEGIALGMFVIYWFVQIAFALEGFFKRSRAMLVTMTLSAIVTSTIIGLVWYYREFPP